MLGSLRLTVHTIDQQQIATKLVLVIQVINPIVGKGRVGVSVYSTAALISKHTQNIRRVTQTPFAAYTLIV